MGSEYASDTSKLLSLSTIYEEAYSELIQAFGINVSARVVGLSL